MLCLKVQTPVLILLLGVLIGCNKDNLKKECDQSACSESDGFINPCICVDLNTPFTLKNRPDRAVLVADVARLITDDATYKFVLFEVKDFRCDECLQSSHDFYVKLAAIHTEINDTTWLYLGIADDPTRVTPLGKSPVQILQSPLDKYTVEFLSLEKIPGDYRLNLSTDYKEAIFMISK